MCEVCARNEGVSKCASSVRTCGLRMSMRSVRCEEVSKSECECVWTWNYDCCVCSSIKVNTGEVKLREGLESTANKN